MTEAIAMSGGPIEEPQEGDGWAGNVEREFTVDGKTYIYRRLPPDPDTGVDPLQAVYCGKKS